MIAASRHSVFLCCAAVAAGLLAPATPALADWLVTSDGSAIETEGPWRLEGEQVVFTLRGGSLAVLPAAEIDFDASQRRTAPPAAPTPAPPGSRSRWTITDADVDRAPDLDDDGGSAGSAASGAPEQTSALTGVSVVSWEETAPRELGVAIAGTLRNDGTDYGAGLRVHVALHDEAGGLIERRTALPTSSTLSPGESTEFSLEFTEVVAFADARFTIEGRSFAGRDEDVAREGEEETPDAEPGAEDLDEAPAAVEDEIPEEELPPLEEAYLDTEDAR